MQSDLLNLKNNTAETQKQTGKNQSISHPEDRFSLFFDLSQCFPLFVTKERFFPKTKDTIRYSRLDSIRTRAKIKNPRTCSTFELAAPYDLMMALIDTYKSALNEKEKADGLERKLRSGKTQILFTCQWFPFM